MKTIYAIISIIIVSCNYSQENIDSAELELFILEEEVVVMSNRVEFNLKVVNNSDTTFLFPAFGAVEESVVNETYYQTGLNFASGTALLVTKDNGELVYFEEPEIGYVDFDDVRDLFSETRKAYTEKMVLLRGNESKTIVAQEELDWYRLEKGEYDLFVIHYSGENLENFISKEEQKVLEEQHSAIIFQGWVKSNTVKLIVE